MTNKQIIIDDIDVSKCEYYKEYSNPNEDGDEYNDICECSITESAFCFDKCNSNCYYKQLKRKEQEIKKICKAFDIEYAIDKETGNLFGRCNKLYKKEQECDRLKHDNEYEVGALEKTIDNLKAENDLFRTCHDNEQAKRRKYEQTLIEIKEVLQFYNNTTIGTDKGNGIFEFEVFNDNILGGKFICCYDTNPAKKALQKISECEVENE